MHTAYLSEDSGATEDTIDITFHQLVEVSTISKKLISLEEALATFGGILGLWMGLGITQFIQIILTYCHIFVFKCIWTKF